MAPMRARGVSSHIEYVSDSARARELYEYYQPEPSANGRINDTETRAEQSPTSNQICSSDTALTAFCQLVTWRIGAQRAMLSVIDDETLYFIAESSKTVDLVDTYKHAPGDDIWFGCSSVSKAGRLCERTVEAKPRTGGEYPSFIVNDLTKDAQFNHLPFISGPPFLKFYAGVPLITRRGIPIGTLFVIDQNARDGLTREDIHFMGTMAQTIMRHMEMSREVEEHRRGMKMSRGLASFVEGRAELIEPEVDTADGEGSMVAGQFETASGLGNGKARPQSASAPGSTQSIVGSAGSSIDHKEKEYSKALLKTEREIMASRDPPPIHRAPDSGSHSLAGTSESVHSPAVDLLDTPMHDNKSEASSLETLFSRAANLIRQAFEVDGGCVFYDAQKGFNLQTKPTRPASLSRENTQMSTDSILSPRGDIDSDHDDRILASPGPGTSNVGEGMFTRSATESRKAVEILGFSTPTTASIHGDEYPAPGPGAQSFIPFHEKALHTLLRRYPRGKLWTLESDVAILSSSEEELEESNETGDPDHHLQYIERRRMRKARMRSDAKFLSRHFPGVRQLLFVPLWDSGRSRWLTGCCVWSTEPTRILTKQVELAFLTAFSNSIMGECSRLDTEIANQKKGDFIGSISHELRSPLHGILASAEFLGEERLSAFVKGLVDTIDSCGRTLLDTINHILDFSKINHFEKTWQKNRHRGPHEGGRDAGTLAVQRSEIPMMNLFAEVDVSVICEEVIESVFAGHVYQNVTAQTFDMVPGAQGKMSDAKNFVSKAQAAPEQVKLSQVSVILDVDMQNYNFITQPGAIRRVIMNLLGNALKYTSHGYVHVTLETTKIEQSHTPDKTPRSMVTLTVADTGKGISSEFLRSKLFTPFTQENSLSSGTGLGLSIVKSIVGLLEGEIAIDSEVGRGTKVKVTLPLLREMPHFADSAGSPKSVASVSRESDQSIINLRARVIGQTVSLYGFDLDTPDPLVRHVGKLLKDSVANFLTKWFGLRVIPFGQNANIIIANEAAPTATSKLAYQFTTKQKGPSVLVLCSHSSLFDRTVPPNTSTRSIGFVAKPVGPLKLARALVQCLDGIPPVVTPNIVEPQPSEETNLSSVFEGLSPVPNAGEMLDNSRMSADSNNARKAIESPTPGVPSEKCAEYPFPIEAPVSMTNRTSVASVHDISSSGQLREMGADPVSSAGLSVNRTPSAASKPRLLLVDDNIINLTLLRTYMHKRQYDIVEEAENGLEAVNKFNERTNGYDIIFMDISMPILDGFGASRQIRAIEESRRNTAAENAGMKKDDQHSALIIALTGLASIQDQSEALSSGIDLFLTKPVSFREVGKMLDNWEANR